MHAIVFIITTQDKVFTSGFWSIDYVGTSKIDVNGLGDMWDCFLFWEKGSLGDSVAYN